MRSFFSIAANNLESRRFKFLNFNHFNLLNEIFNTNNI